MILIIYNSVLHACDPPVTNLIQSKKGEGLGSFVDDRGEQTVSL